MMFFLALIQNEAIVTIYSFPSLPLCLSHVQTHTQTLNSNQQEFVPARIIFFVTFSDAVESSPFKISKIQLSTFSSFIRVVLQLSLIRISSYEILIFIFPHPLYSFSFCQQKSVNSYLRCVRTHNHPRASTFLKWENIYYWLYNKKMFTEFFNTRFYENTRLKKCWNYHYFTLQIVHTSVSK